MAKPASELVNATASATLRSRLPHVPPDVRGDETAGWGGATWDEGGMDMRPLVSMTFRRLPGQLGGANWKLHEASASTASGFLNTQPFTTRVMHPSTRLLPMVLEATDDR